LLSSCPSAVSSHPSFYTKLATALLHQLEHVPKDFFVDPLSQENFLNNTLQDLFELCEPPFAPAASPTPGRERQLAELTASMRALQKCVQGKFGWAFSELEYAGTDHGPTIVE